MISFIDNFAPIKKNVNIEHDHLIKLLVAIKGNHHDAKEAIQNYQTKKLRNKSLRKFAVD